MWLNLSARYLEKINKLLIITEIITLRLIAVNNLLKIKCIHLPSKKKNIYITINVTPET